MDNDIIKMKRYKNNPNVIILNFCFAMATTDLYGKQNKVGLWLDYIAHKP